MLNPVEVMEVPLAPTFDATLAQETHRLRTHLDITPYLRRSPRELFYVLARLLGRAAPIIHDTSVQSGGAFWYRDPQGQSHLVLPTQGCLRFHQAIFLLAHHLVQRTYGWATPLVAPFDDAAWQTDPRYTRHRIVYVALTTGHLSPLFQPTC